MELEQDDIITGMELDTAKSNDKGYSINIETQKPLNTGLTAKQMQELNGALSQLVEAVREMYGVSSDPR